jgi:hypothetical protein
MDPGIKKMVLTSGLSATNNALDLHAEAGYISNDKED